MNIENSHEPRRVLLVDDHIESIVSVGKLLEAYGYEVRMAFNGLQAVSTAVRFRPDVAFIDLSLPMLDGYGVARQLRAMPETRDATLIALTGWGADDVMDEVRDAGFDLHIVKPLSFDAMLAALATVRA